MEIPSNAGVGPSYNNVTQFHCVDFGQAQCHLAEE